MDISNLCDHPPKRTLRLLTNLDPYSLREQKLLCAAADTCCRVFVKAINVLKPYSPLEIIIEKWNRCLPLFFMVLKETMRVFPKTGYLSLYKGNLSPYEVICFNNREQFVCRFRSDLVDVVNDIISSARPYNTILSLTMAASNKDYSLDAVYKILLQNPGVLSKLMIENYMAVGHCENLTKNNAKRQKKK